MSSAPWPVGGLREHGYTVLEAKHGREALDGSRRTIGAIDLVISDVVMPEMGGRELARRVWPLLRPVAAGPVHVGLHR